VALIIKNANTNFYLYRFFDEIILKVPFLTVYIVKGAIEMKMT